MAESDLLKILSPLGRGRRAHARRVRGFERFKLNRRCHELKHSIDIREYVVVPKAKHQIPHRFQSLRSLRVGGDALSMLPAIDFNNELRIGEDEVHYKPVNVRLTLELQSQKATVAKPLPHPFA
jgi:hypothetical protein